MTTQEVMQELEKYGNENTTRIFRKHGANIPLFGVKVGDMKKIQKKIKKDHELSLSLYDTGNGDAMYFAGLIADESKITKRDLKKWVRNANWYMISEYTVAWIAAESRYGWELALEWIESDKDHISAAGWSTLGSLMSIMEDDDLDVKHLSKLLTRVGRDIHKAPNRTRYTMNNFVIAAGGYVHALTKRAKEIADKIGKVQCDMGETACKVPLAGEYIAKIEKAGRIGKKRKMARC